MHTPQPPDVPGVFTGRQTPMPSVAELKCQLEDLLHVVWTLEAQWRVDDKIDRAIKLLPS